MMKKQRDDAYPDAEVDYISGKFYDLSRYHISNKHHLAWKLRSTVAQVPLHNFLVISGDLNAKLGPEHVNFTYNTETNRNGEHLINFMKEFNLFSSNPSFMKPKGQLWTFEYPNGGRAQLDYLIFRKKWRNSVKDSRSY